MTKHPEIVLDHWLAVIVFLNSGAAGRLDNLEEVEATYRRKTYHHPRNRSAGYRPIWHEPEAFYSDQPGRDVRKSIVHFIERNSS